MCHFGRGEQDHQRPPMRACGSSGKERLPVAAGHGQRKASTAPPSNFGGCTLMFNGPDANQVLLFARVFTVPNSNPSAPTRRPTPAATRPSPLEGTITNAGVADFGKKLTVPNIDQLPLPLDDFTATSSGQRHHRAVLRRQQDPQHPGHVRVQRHRQPTDTANHAAVHGAPSETGS